VCSLLKVVLSLVGGNIIFICVLKFILNEIPEFPYSGIVDVHALFMHTTLVSF